MFSLEVFALNLGLKSVLWVQKPIFCCTVNFLKSVEY